MLEEKLEKSILETPQTSYYFHDNPDNILQSFFLLILK